MQEVRCSWLELIHMEEINCFERRFFNLEFRVADVWYWASDQNLFAGCQGSHYPSPYKGAVDAYFCRLGAMPFIICLDNKIATVSELSGSSNTISKSSSMSPGSASNNSIEIGQK